MAILTLPEVKDALKIKGGDTDAELTAVLDGVVEGVNGLCGYSEATPFTETVRSTHGHIIVRQRPLLTVTTVVGQRYGSVATAGLFWATESSIIRSKYDAPAIEDDWYTVVYEAGRTSVPASIKHGAIVIIQHQWATRRGGGTSRATSGQGGQDDASTQPGFTYAIPNRAIQIFRDAGYMRGPLVG